MNKIVLKINKTSAIEAYPLYIELRIFDWIFYQVCSNEMKKNIRLTVSNFNPKQVK